MNNQALSTAEVDLEEQLKRTTEEILESICDPDAFRDSTLRIPRKKALSVPTVLEVGNEESIATRVSLT